PRAFGEAADNLFQGHDGIIRIRRLELRLVDDPGLPGSALAERMARALADAIAAAMTGAPLEGVRTWPSVSAYRASYALLRLGVAAEPPWAFPDLAAYGLLGAPEAVVAALAAAGAEGIQALATAVAEAGQSTSTLVAALGDAGSAALLDAAAGSARPSSSAEPSMFRPVVQAWHGTSGITSPVAHALASLLSALQQLDAPSVATGEVPSAARVALALAAIAELVALERSPGAVAAALQAGRAPDGVVPPSARAALAELTTDVDLRQQLAAVARDVAGRVAPPPTERRALSRAQPPPAAETEHVASEFAGLALILPLVAPLGLDAAEPPGALRSIALAVLGLDADAPAARDRGLALLCPADPRHPAVPDRPPPEAAWPLLEAGGSSEEGRARAGSAPLEAWTALWLAAFAAQLPGLQQSSPSYLRRQFLHRPGQLLGRDQQLTVTLSPLPLGIVLRMAGLLGDRGPVPHLGGRRLTITVERG
ncbi:MAG: hypothetical protein AB7W59_21205, partial [Acidimicrobiia bacterium]